MARNRGWAPDDRLPAAGVDGSDVPQSPSASVNKITGRHLMNGCNSCL